MKLVEAMTISEMVEVLTKAIAFSTEVRYLTWREGNHIVFNQTIHLLWNLEVLKLRRDYSSPILIPSEIWEMPRLRHLHVWPNALLANPKATQMEGNCFIILKDLQTLWSIFNFDCTKEVVDRIPNLKCLRIEYKFGYSIQPHSYSLCNIAQLQKLESLDVHNAKENICFPNSLRKLELDSCQIAWEDMSIIGSLPLLEILHLRNVKGSEWNLEEGEFVQLKTLEFWESSLKHWRAESIHFPVLENLELCSFASLEGIPLGIGDIPTLQLIHVAGCSVSTKKSAEAIREEQQELGNDTLKVIIIE